MTNLINQNIILLALAMLPLSAFQTNSGKASDQIKWYTIEEAQQLVKENPKKIYIDMYTDWCGWCKVMDQKTFTDADIIQKLNEDFYAVKFDAEGKEEVTFRDKTFKFVAQGNRGYHELAAALMNGQMSYPTSVFLDENLNLISPLPGYLTPDKLAPILDYIGEDHYKTVKWEDYMKNN
jgi:thioredoxin-related protein